MELVDRMLLADPTARPTIADIHTTLMGIRTAATTTTTTTTTTAILAGPEPEPLAPTRLKGRGCARPPGGRRPRPPSEVLLGDSSGSSWNRERIRAHHEHSPGRQDPGPCPARPDRGQAAPDRVPTLVTRGSTEPIMPMAWAQAATRLLPLNELAVVPGPHNANYGGADHLAELVLAFLHRRVLAQDGQPS